MTINQLAAFLQRITYKPRCRFELSQSFHEANRWFITLHLWTVDADHPDKWNFTNQSQPFSTSEIASWTPEIVLEILFDMTVSLEYHETCEFFRIDGRFWRDPHPEVNHGKKYRAGTGGRAEQEESPQTPVRIRRRPMLPSE